ncbi:MAG: hypothetical protein IJN02_00060 [Bacteroidales bacterium]|nr:hypothetical protein [Bacteroidales bacterium]
MKPLEQSYSRCRDISELNHYTQPDDFYNPVTHVYEFFDDNKNYHYYRPDFVGHNGDVVIESDKGIYQWSSRARRWRFNGRLVSHFTNVDSPQLLLGYYSQSLQSIKIDQCHTRKDYPEVSITGTSRVGKIEILLVRRSFVEFRRKRRS